VKVTDVTKFERQNPGLSVNVFGWKVGLYPLHLSKQEGHAIDLLLIADEKGPQKTHYVWIKDFARMLYKTATIKSENTHAADACTCSRAKTY